MRAIITILKNDQLGAKIDPEYISPLLPEPMMNYAFEGISPFCSLRILGSELIDLLAESCGVEPLGPVSFLNDFGVFGFPALFFDIPRSVRSVVDVPGRATVFVVRKRRPRKLSALLPLLNMNLPEIKVGTSRLREYKVLNINGKRIIIGRLIRPGVNMFFIVGPDKDVPLFKGTGYENGQKVDILIGGFENEKLAIEILGCKFTDIKLEEYKPDGRNTSNSSGPKS